MDKHIENLQKLCRICGCWKSKRKEQGWKQIGSSAVEIETAFVRKDDANVHPKQICKSCLRAITR